MVRAALSAFESLGVYLQTARCDDAAEFELAMVS